MEIRFEDYHDEDTQIQVIMDLVDNELSEPYNIFTYRYFVNNWPNLTFLAWHGDKCVGVIICKVRPAPPSRPASTRFSHSASVKTVANELTSVAPRSWTITRAGPTGGTSPCSW